MKATSELVMANICQILNKWTGSLPNSPHITTLETLPPCGQSTQLHNTSRHLAELFRDRYQQPVYTAIYESKTEGDKSLLVAWLWQFISENG